MNRTHAKFVVPVVAVAMVVSMTGVPAASAGTTARLKADSTFGVNATGTVTFWIRDATESAALKLIPEFNATHQNLKIV